MHEFESVLTSAQVGAEWAWRIIYDEYFRALVGYFRVQGSRDPENRAGDVMLRMSRTIGGFSGSEAKFRSWVFTIAHNLLIDERRRATRRPEHVEAAPPEQVEPSTTEQVVLTQMGTEWVQRALEELSADQREVLTLRIVGGFTIPEIAEVTGRGVGAVKQLQRRALKRLARHFEASPYPRDHSERSP